METSQLGYRVETASILQTCLLEDDELYRPPTSPTLSLAYPSLPNIAGAATSGPQHVQPSTWLQVQGPSKPSGHVYEHSDCRAPSSAAGSYI